MVSPIQYFTPEQIAKAKEVDLLTYLQHYEPQELVHVGGDTYCTREHDSLKISNGKWHWFSHGFGGVSALDYLIKVKGYPFLQAVEVILGRAAALPPVSRAPPKREPRKLLLPERNDSADRVKRYLMGRGIHPNIIDYCLERKLLLNQSSITTLSLSAMIGKARPVTPPCAERRAISKVKPQAAISTFRFPSRRRNHRSICISLNQPSTC